MTGRDLIIYILNNNLEDEKVYKDGKLLGFMTTIDASIKFGVGITTVKTWFDLGYLDGIKIGDTIYIPANSKPYIPDYRRNE